MKPQNQLKPKRKNLQNQLKPKKKNLLNQLKSNLQSQQNLPNLHPPLGVAAKKKPKMKLNRKKMKRLKRNKKPNRKRR